MTKYLDLAKKLNELAKRGEHGEKYSAKLALDRIMAKYGITAADLELEEEIVVRIYAPSKYGTLFIQVVSTIMGHKFKCMRSRDNSRYMILLATRLQELELRARWDFYRKAYDRQLEIFRHAFIIKNRLFPKDDGTPPSELTEEEHEERKKASLMAFGMESAHYHKQIGG